MNPPAKKRLMVSPEEWLGHALSDLKLAKLGKEETPDILPEQICFHAQQAVEKTFKAVLLCSPKQFFPWFARTRLGYRGCWARQS